MEYKYFPHTQEEISEMLKTSGLETLDDLYSEVPEAIRFRKEYNLPEALSAIWRAEQTVGLLCRSRRLRPLLSVCCQSHRRAFRIPYLIHSISGRNIPRHTSLYLRISVDDGRTDGDGHLKCIHV